MEGILLPQLSGIKAPGDLTLSDAFPPYTSASLFNWTWLSLCEWSPLMSLNLIHETWAKSFLSKLCIHFFYLCFYPIYTLNSIRQCKILQHGFMNNYKEINSSHSACKMLDNMLYLNINININILSNTN